MAPRVVLDTHVLLDCWVFGDARVAQLWQSILQRQTIALRSDDTDAELREVLARAQFNVDMLRRRDLLDCWCGLAEGVPRVWAAPWQCTDPRDQKFLDLACAGRASALLTRDRALLKVARQARHEGLAIMTPEQWLAMRAQQKPPPT